MTSEEISFQNGLFIVIYVHIFDNVPCMRGCGGKVTHQVPHNIFDFVVKVRQGIIVLVFLLTYVDDTHTNDSYLSVFMFTYVDDV